MKQDDIKDLLKKNYEYDDKTKTLTLPNGDKAYVDCRSLYITNESRWPFVTTTENGKKADDEKKPYFFFVGDSDDKNTLQELIAERYVPEGQDDDYIVAIETEYIEAVKKDGTTLSSLGNIGDLIKVINKNNYEVGIYGNYYEGQRKISNSYFIRLIRVTKKTDGTYDLKHLDQYFASSDSRTYKNATYTICLYPERSKIAIPKENEDWPKNLLMFGAPGTGKSYSIDKKINDLGWEENYKRVTFYEDYSYETFVGSYIPRQKDKETTIEGNIGTSGNVHLTEKSEGIVYEFVPGIFLQMVADAYVSYLPYIDIDSVEKVPPTSNLDVEVPPTNYVLVIEEINRANAASVFGDMFQILDRNLEGWSEYEISLSAEIKRWMVKHLEDKAKELYGDICEGYKMCLESYVEHFKLPPNLYIWATMNSADQGVFPLDSAFKRRWSFMYKSIDEPRTDNNKYIYVPWEVKGVTEKYFVSWDAFKKAINNVMDKNNIEEDRMIGAWYFKESEFKQIFEFTNSASIDRFQKTNPLCDKLFNYLRQDVFRNNPEAIFNEKYTSLHKIRKAMNDGVAINNILKFDNDTITDIQKSMTNPNKMKFCLKTGSSASITLPELKNYSSNSNAISWELDSTFVIDKNITLAPPEDNESVSPNDKEKDALIEETQECIREHIRSKHDQNDSEDAVKEFERWVENDFEQQVKDDNKQNSSDTDHEEDEGNKQDAGTE
jgi:hypothetical protein